MFRFIEREQIQKEKYICNARSIIYSFFHFHLSFFLPVLINNAVDRSFIERLKAPSIISREKSNKTDKTTLGCFLPLGQKFEFCF